METHIHYFETILNDNHIEQTSHEGRQSSSCWFLGIRILFMAFECQGGSHVSESPSAFVVDSLGERVNSKVRISDPAENCGVEHLESKVFDLETNVFVRTMDDIP
ncbi:hypothetical protein ACJRO7_007401 [Eucalyptus globulus]|uniref:Uncharacterized protein n=1 Tax=Eucalyptus globulus TaxID=34317 RepID=A0ABD3IL32_EUCGL